jgi:Asp-tRNA(Asn)/Glu-tRNA(Gln) amidotransferase C subunit
MPEAPDSALGAETIRRVASEQLRLALTPAEVDALATSLTSLLEEIRRVTAGDRANAEPETSVIVEDWPS